MVFGLNDSDVSRNRAVHRCILGRSCTHMQECKHTLAARGSTSMDLLVRLSHPSYNFGTTVAMLAALLLPPKNVHRQCFIQKFLQEGHNGLFKILGGAP